MPLGASIIDLFPGPAEVLDNLSAGVRSFLENFTAVDLSSATTAGGTFHYGTVLPKVSDLAATDDTRGWVIQGAGIDRGVRFQLATTRVATPTGSNTEPAPANFQLDLFFEQLSILLPMLKAAQLVPAAGTTPPHLRPDPTAPEVRLVGRAVLRFTSVGGSLSRPQLVDYPDPFVPAAPSGTVATMQFAPPHFFIGNSAIGLTVRKLTLDASTTSTPADIMARQQGPAWTGLALQEATLYLPPETPFAGNLVLGVRDVLLGDPFGLQGEVRIEWGADAVTQTPVDVLQAQDAAGEDGWTAVTQEWPPGDLDRTVVFDPTRPLRFFAQVTSGPVTQDSVRWILPDGSTASGLATPEFRARAGDTLVCVRSEVPEGGGTPLDGPEIRHHFQAAAAPASAISLSLGTQVHANVVHVSGTRGELGSGLVFSAPDAADADTLQWQLGDGAAAPAVQGPSFTLDAAALPLSLIHI